MEQIKALVHSLKEERSKDKILLILQQINDLLVTDYMLELKNGMQIYPLDVESYFYTDEFSTYSKMHRDELQKNHFGKLYFHRTKKKREFRYKSHGGVDLCLSDDDSFYLGILLRRAKFVNEQSYTKVNKGKGLLRVKDPSIEDGPNNLAKRILRNLGTGHYIDKKYEELTESEKREKLEFNKGICALEDEVVLKRVSENSRCPSQIDSSPIHLPIDMASKALVDSMLDSSTSAECNFRPRSQVNLKLVNRKR